MIVISGALVLVALVLLVIGVTMPELDFVYASIAVSLVSLVFLIIGILQRRGSSSAAAAPSERAPVTMSKPAAGRAEEQPVTAVSPRPASGGWSKAGDGGRRAATASAAPAVAVKSFPSKAAPAMDEPMDEDEPMYESDGTVLIVPGRPKYHVEGCRFLAGKSADEVDVLDARDDGFTPCGFCKPDAVLAGQLDEEPLELDAQDEDVAPPVPAAATSRRRSPAGGTRAVGDQPPLAARAKGALTKVGASSKFAKVFPTPSASGKGASDSDTADHEPSQPSQPVEPAAAASAPARATTSTTGKPLVRKPGAKAVTVDPAPHKPAASEPRLAKPVPVKPTGSRTGTGKPVPVKPLGSGTATGKPVPVKPLGSGTGTGKPVPAGTAAAAATSTGKPAIRSAPAQTTSPASAQAMPLVRKPGAKAVTVDGAPHKPAASEPKLAKPVSIKPPTRSTPAKPAPVEPPPAKVTGGRAAATKAMPIPAPAKPAAKVTAKAPAKTAPVKAAPTKAAPTKAAPTKAAPVKAAKAAPAKPMVRKPGAKAVTVEAAPHPPAPREPKIAKPQPIKPPPASRAPAKPAPAKGTAASVARSRSTPQRWGSS